MKHLRYLSYLLRHKWFVLLAGLQTGAPIWRLLVHDLSKLRPSEWIPYANHFYGSGSKSYSRAWLLHQHRNPHHWQFWLLRENDGQIVPLPMPESFVREMVADWAGAGRAIIGKWGVAGWYDDHKEQIILHEDARRLAEELLVQF